MSSSITCCPLRSQTSRPTVPRCWSCGNITPTSPNIPAGLGTAAFDRALSSCDANLGRLRAALAKLHVEDRTDLVIVSDHGFATIKMRVDLAGLLVAHGLKQSKTSDDVVVASNFGSDEIYLSPRIAPAARAGLMRKIVEYAAAQPWCGPIFSRAAGTPAAHGYAGEIPGTFDQGVVRLAQPARSADLTISFRESTGEDNSKLTGPQAPALLLTEPVCATNPTSRSRWFIRCWESHTRTPGPSITAGGGTHGALGEYEMHNFGAATGPDFRRAYIDKAPTSNIDVARTIAALLGIQDDAAALQPVAAGRLLKEALSNGPAAGPYRRVPSASRSNCPTSASSRRSRWTGWTAVHIQSTPPSATTSSARNNARPINSRTVAVPASFAAIP